MSNATVVVVTSGKGGVGKTTTTAAIASALAKEGYQVCAIDFDVGLRKKRLMTLVHLFLIHRYKAASVHYVSPTEDNYYQTQKMKSHGLFSEVADEVGHIIVANVNEDRIAVLLEEDREALIKVIRKEYP